MAQINVVSSRHSLQGQMDLSLLFFGRQDCPPGHFWGPGLRDSYILHYVHSGSGTYRIGDKTYTLTAGQGFLIPPGTLVYYRADQTDPWTYSWVGFKGLHAKAFMQRAQLSPEDPVFDAGRGSWLELFYSELESALAEPHGDLLSQSTLYRLIAELIRCSPSAAAKPGPSNTKEAYVGKAIEYMESSYSQRISIADIARFVGLDRTYLSSLFKVRFGVSLQIYLLEYRMNRAVQLLRSSKELTVSDVARSVGYTDPFLFSKMFKKVIGSSPSSCREPADYLEE
nr:AraC family transcriptional regulator [Paenibacillus sp. FJAT-26967]